MSKTIATSGKGWSAAATFTRAGKRPILRLTIIDNVSQEASTEDIDIRTLVDAMRGDGMTLGGLVEIATAADDEEEEEDSAFGSFPEKDKEDPTSVARTG